MDAYARDYYERKAEDLLNQYDCRIVDFLRDEKGIYGISFIDQSEAAAGEIDPNKALITRPDRLPDTNTDTALAVLQPLFSTRGRSVFGVNYIEEAYRRVIHLTMLGRALPCEGYPIGGRKLDW
jgi:hypothetical protein